jgi:hypothetical protein
LARELQEAYTRYNRRFFGGLLPAIPVVWSQINPAELACFDYVLDPADGDIVSGTIRMSPCIRFSDRIWKRILLHEMAHVKLRSHPSHTRKNGNCHGAAFIAEMRRLAAVGAFDRIW